MYCTASGGSVSCCLRPMMDLHLVRSALLEDEAAGETAAAALEDEAAGETVF